MKIYLAGPLFTPYERRFIDECAARIRASGMEVFVPHEHAAPPDQRTAKAVFDKDGEGLFPANAVVALLDGPMVDDGTACEIGIFYGLKRHDTTKKGVIGLVTDSRVLESGDGTYEGKGLNLYVLGCIEEMGEICNSIDKGLEILQRWERELA